MAETKMGMHYAREIIENFREVATDNKFPELCARMKKVADGLEVVHTKIYFKTQKGNEQFEKLAGELADVKARIAGAADEAAAKAIMDPILKNLEEVTDMVMNMKVRMT